MKKIISNIIKFASLYFSVYLIFNLEVILLNEEFFIIACFFLIIYISKNILVQNLDLINSEEFFKISRQICLSVENEKLSSGKNIILLFDHEKYDVRCLGLCKLLIAFFELSGGKYLENNTGIKRYDLFKMHGPMFNVFRQKIIEAYFFLYANVNEDIRKNFKQFIEEDTLNINNEI